MYPNIAKVKRNGVYQNLPGFAQQSGDADIEEMIANKETNTTAQFAHPKGYYFILNDILYQADEDIAVNDIIAVGTNCHVEVLGNDVGWLNNTVKKINEDMYGTDTSRSITYEATRGGYLSVFNNKPYLTNSPITSHQVMLINDLEEYGLAEGTILTIKTGNGVGDGYAVAYSNTEIPETGYFAFESGTKFPSTELVEQTVISTIPVGTTSIAIYTRPAVTPTPTITYKKNSGTGLDSRVEELENSIDDIESDITEITTKVNEIRYFDCVKKPFDFSDKNLIFFGDSITYGYIAASGGQPATQATNQYPKVFSEGVGANSYNNQGTSGTCIYGSEPYQIANKVIAANLSTYDYVFIAGGVNDWQTGVTEAQLISAMESMCSHLYSNYNGEVIFITPINEAGRTPSVTPAQTLQNVRNVITRIALKYGFSVVQGWEFPFPIDGDDTTYINLMYQDKLHPTELGYAMYAKALRNAVC